MSDLRTVQWYLETEGGAWQQWPQGTTPRVSISGLDILRRARGKGQNYIWIYNLTVHALCFDDDSVWDVVSGIRPGTQASARALEDNTLDPATGTPHWRKSLTPKEEFVVGLTCPGCAGWAKYKVESNNFKCDKCGSEWVVPPDPTRPK